MRNARLFSLSAPTLETEPYPSVSLSLPDGSMLIAKAINDENFPAIDINLLPNSDEEEQKIYFIEFNPECEKGRELMHWRLLPGW